MSPVGTAEPRRVKPVSQPRANPRRHANTRRRDRPGRRFNPVRRDRPGRRDQPRLRAWGRAIARDSLTTAVCSVVPPGLLSYKAAPLPSDESLGYYHMPLRGTAPPPGHRSAATAHRPPPPGHRSAATAHEPSPTGRTEIGARKPPETRRGRAVIGSQLPRKRRGRRFRRKRSGGGCRWKRRGREL
jgi:hypothetical protein